MITAENNRLLSTIIFFVGDTGQGFLNWVKFLVGDFVSPHISFYFPTAPLRPYTPLQGEVLLNNFYLV